MGEEVPDLVEEALSFGLVLPWHAKHGKTHFTSLHEFLQCLSHFAKECLSHFAQHDKILGF